MKNYSEKAKAVMLFTLPCALNIVVFSILYFFAFNIPSQSPDNHLAYYNFFGIFYKDLFLTDIVSALVTLTVFILLLLNFNKVRLLSPVKLVFFVLSAVLCGWFCSYVGSMIESVTDFSFGYEVILEAFVTALCIYLFYSATVKRSQYV